MTKVGDVITLDCGYGAHTYDAPCKVISIREGHNVFNEPKTYLTVEELGTGKRFETNM